MKRNLSLKQKFYRGFGLVGVLVVISCFLTLKGFYLVLDGYESTLDKDLEIQKSLQAIELKAVQALHTDQPYGEKLQEMEKLFAQSKANSIEIGLANQWDKSYSNYKIFRKKTENYYSLKEETKKGELKFKKEFYTHLGGATKLVFSNNLPTKVRVYLKTLEVHYKDYMIYGQEKFYTRAKNTVADFVSYLNKSKVPVDPRNAIKAKTRLILKAMANLKSNNEKSIDIASAIESENELLSSLALVEKGLEEIKSKKHEKLNFFREVIIWALLGMGLFNFIGIFAISRILDVVTKSITGNLIKLNCVTDESKEMGTTLLMASEKTAEAANQQAAAIQETVATLNEITEMVNQSVDNANKTADKAKESYSVAGQGQKAVVEMKKAIEDIKDNNLNVVERMKKGSDEIQDIVILIKEISEKTKVINDIVFQTKLLSFNASVEAARAGEHGKGFAVVAEEVGNLAQLSGKSAREIEELLGRSVDRVEEIIEANQREVQQLIDLSDSKIDGGVGVANRCAEVLEQVVGNVEEMRKLVEHIAYASKEQAEGVSNINSAMSELDNTTQENVHVAQDTNQMSRELVGSAESMAGFTKRLEVIVLGGNMKDSILQDQVDAALGESSHKEDSGPTGIFDEGELEEFSDNVVPFPTESGPSSATKEAAAGGASDFPDEDDPRFQEI
jgi:methyl-accepting chemotaxis protein